MREAQASIYTRVGMQTYRVVFDETGEPSRIYLQVALRAGVFRWRKVWGATGSRRIGTRLGLAVSCARETQ